MDFTGLWIPKEIWEMEDLNLSEKIVLAMIYGLSKNGNECTASNNYFATFLGIKKKHASTIIQSLSRKKRIAIPKYQDTLSRKIRIPYPELKGHPIPKNQDHIIKNNNTVDSKEYKEGKKFNFKKEIIELGVEEKVVSEWLKVRSKKKAVNTEIAFIAIEKEIRLTGLSANQCITKAVENSWSGFKAEWLINEKSNFNGRTFKTSAEIAIDSINRAKDDLLREIEEKY